MRNVNEKLRGDVCVIDVGFILTMRNVNKVEFKRVNDEDFVLY